MSARNCQSSYGDQYHNPCEVCETNSASCESTPSVLENFIRHIFGSIEKTEENGEVTWILPCQLDVGLPDNPRQEGEGLACYFLRLFNEGIVGLQGPPGEPGPAGADGVPGYTITLSSFTQPTLDNPTFTVKMAPNPMLVAGMIVYIEKCGWAQVNSVGAEYNVLCTLIEAAPDAGSGTVAPGKKVAVAGPRGRKGDKGDKGDTGPQGPPGPTFTAYSGITLASGANNFDLTTSWQAIDFSASDPAITVPYKGWYLVWAQAILAKIGSDQQGGDFGELKIYNVTQASDISMAYGKIYYVRQGSQYTVTMLGLANANANNVLALYGRASHNGVYTVVRENCSIGYVMLQATS